MTRLAFGLRSDLRPESDDAPAVWGARWIWPDDLVHDRQDITGHEDDRARLVAWLTRGALNTARCRAKVLAQTYELSPVSDELVTLYEDERGVVKASPQRSSGYLYVAAWLKIP